MSLIKTTLQQQLKELFEEFSKKEDADIDGFAEKMATIIDSYIKTATVTTSVTTTGSAAAQTGVGTGTLS